MHSASAEKSVFPEKGSASLSDMSGAYLNGGWQLISRLAKFKHSAQPTYPPQITYTALTHKSTIPQA